MSLEQDILSLGKRARAAARDLAVMRTARKNSILEAMADELEARRDLILEANAKDLEAGKESGLTNAMIDRLDLNGKRFEGMINGVANLVALKDPVGRELSNWVRPNGLVISKVSVPIGVVGIIYESRPNVTADAAALCFKSGNASILRGGKEAFHSNCAIADAIQAGGEEKGLPPNSVQLLRTTDRAAVMPLIKMKDHLDVIIPRGGESLINFVADNATVPVLKHDKGVCHIYIDADADQDKALDIIENAKVQRPGVCNAVETILVDMSIAEEFLPKVANRLLALDVELRGDKITCELIPEAKEATEEDWHTEYLDLILAVKTVTGVEEAISHIATYGSGHSEAVLSSNADVQAAFQQAVDASTVYVNASTRFTDGAEFGLGAEIGISTNKLHARGPMGLEELTTYKYLVTGTGQIRE